MSADIYLTSRVHQVGHGPGVLVVVVDLHVIYFVELDRGGAEVAGLVLHVKRVRADDLAQPDVVVLRAFGGVAVGVAGLGGGSPAVLVVVQVPTPVEAGKVSRQPAPLS